MVKLHHAAGADAAPAESGERASNATYAALERERTFSTAPDPIRSVLQHSKSHPRMLESNATSHVWPLGALAELLDNAQDQECGATKVDVDAYEVSPGTMAITVQDDGFGMHRGQLQNMLSFGFSSKEHVVGNVGRFGIGFKSGSMRLANDALILTRQEGSASVALLSTTFLSAINADDILIPMFTWKVESSSSHGAGAEAGGGGGGGGGRRTYVAQTPSNTAEWEENMGVIEDFTFLKSEREVLAELDKIDTATGTRIVLFNLKDPPEFDFERDPRDIRMMGSLGLDDDDKPRTSARRPIFQQHRPGQQMTLDVPEDYSLRAYMEVLYLRPTVTFTLRKEDIVPRCPIARLEVEYYQFEPYTPKGIPEERTSPVIVHLGYQEEKSKHCGFHIYNKNRLIRMYQRFGAQLQANVMMKDMLGVVEADCLEPTHNKQAFNTTDVAYAKFQKHIEKSMNDYYFGVQKVRLAGTSGRKVAHPGKSKGKAAKSGKGGKGAAKTKSTAKGKKRKSRGDSESEDTEDEEDDEDDDGGARGAVGKKKKRNPAAKEGKFKADFFPRILRKLMGRKNSWPFNEPVDAEYWGVLDYYEIIKNPMDFGTIATQLDAGAYKTEGSAHGPLRFVSDVRQVFYNAWTYNEPGHQVYGYAQEVARIFETELQRAVGDKDDWGLLAGNVLAMCGPPPVKPGEKKGGDDEDEGERGGGGGAAGALVRVKDEEAGKTYEIDQQAINAMVETRAAQAITTANATRDEALAKLQEERAAREAFEAELEAQTTENIRRVREEERERIRRLEGEKETLMSALSDSKEMKGWLQDKCKTQEAEIASLRDRLAAAEAAASVMQKGPLLPPSP